MRRLFWNWINTSPGIQANELTLVATLNNVMLGNLFNA